mmetsp:Transcript_75614/g.208612  ORF Transcript_75614/g.208612 Transcript_75614/m.208612 type:complete len:708 (+) Transcript_75614:103-2226(+)
MSEAGDSMEDITSENSRLRQELEKLRQQHEREMAEYEAKMALERDRARTHSETVQQRTQELETMKSRMVRLTRQLDEEVSRRDQIQQESQQLERKVQDLQGNGQIVPTPMRNKTGKDRTTEDELAARERGSQVSTKLMRVVDQWMRHRDLQQALLRGASINDAAFATLAQALMDCPSLQTVDLSQNLLTMDSCSDLCQLITTAPSLSFMSLAENLLSLRSVGYFMTAVMERQNTKKLMPLDLLDLQGNEGLVAAAQAPVPQGLLQTVTGALGSGRLPPNGAELVTQVMRALWRFLHDTGHPQVRDTRPDEVAFHVLEKVTIRKMENALMKILLLGGETGTDSSARPITANLAFTPALEAEQGAAGQDASGSRPGSGRSTSQQQPGAGRTTSVADTSGMQRTQSQAGFGQSQGSAAGFSKGHERSGASIPPRTRDTRVQMADPFADLKTAFEPPREKQTTFNLEQVVTRHGTVLMNMLERLLETTDIDAFDVKTDQTLLEYACQTGNMGLAKLCYRRGAKLSAKTGKGETCFNIVTRNKRYDMMEFLHTYGVKVNSADATGRSALHIAAGSDDVDAVCRLLEWGADVNCRDNKKRTPIHIAAAGGNMKTTMLLLEVGADMNAKDEREYTAVAHAEANNHFVLMDRLVQLGGRGHGLQSKAPDLAKTKSTKQIGELVVSAGMLKSSSLGRIGKVAVSGMPGPLSPSPLR